MRAKKLIQKIADFLNISNFTLSGKKRALKELLQKLKEKKAFVAEKLKKEEKTKEEELLKEELDLLSLHIAKATKKLDSL